MRTEQLATSYEPLQKLLTRFAPLIRLKYPDVLIADSSHVVVLLLFSVPCFVCQFRRFIHLMYVQIIYNSATFWKIAVHLFDRMFLFVILAIFRFGFEGRILDQIVPVPGHCLLFFL